MNTKQFFLRFLIIPAFAMSLFSCSEEDIVTNSIGSTLEIVDNNKVSTFYLDKKHITIPDSASSLVLALHNINNLNIQEFMASVSDEKQLYRLTINISESETILDGIYSMCLYEVGSKEILSRSVVKFEKNMMHCYEGTVPKYKYLTGDGTLQNPYKINNSQDFGYLLMNLNIDSIFHGYSTYFSQTASFDAPDIGDGEDGREYSSEAFAGTYMGNGYTIDNVDYLGSYNPNIDTHRGLFRALLDGAEIRNLKVVAAMSRVSTYAGALAGYSEGNIKLDSITITGKLEQKDSYCGGMIGSHSNGMLLISNSTVDITIGCEGNYVGGLVGYVNPKDSLKVINTRLTGSIKGSDHVGGLFGYICAPDAACVIKNTSNLNPNFYIEGRNHIGGLIGELRDARSFNVDGVSLRHSVSTSDAELKIIGGEDYVGGLVGKLSGLSNNSVISNTVVNCPISGIDYVGGMLGYFSNTSTRNIEFTNSTVETFVTGNDNIGGFVGYVFNNAGITLNGQSGLIEKTDSGKGAVTGHNYVGGIIGTHKSLGNMLFQDDAFCKLNVSGNEYVGGIAGSVDPSSSTLEINVSKFSFSSNAKVSGKTRLGGLFGSLNSVRLIGRNEFNYNEGHGIVVPKSSRFASDFSGVISISDGSSYIGGAVGIALNSIIKGVSVKTTIKAKSLNYAGGLVGKITYANNSSVNCLEDCTFMGMIDGSECIGGIVGYKEKDGQVRDCINYAEINGSKHVGGIVGCLDYSGISATHSIVYYCVNTSNVKASGENVGGVVGKMKGDNKTGHWAGITRCANYGYVEGSTTGIGGILGQSTTRYAQVNNCANHGHIKAVGSARIGGIAGSMGNDPGGITKSESYNLKLGNCANLGTVESTDSGSRIGGILGYQEEGESDWENHNDSWLHDCYNKGKIVCSGSAVGGILGKADHYSYIQLCYNAGMVNNGKGNAAIGTRVSDLTTVYDDALYYLSGTGTAGDKKWAKATARSADQAKVKSNFDFNFDSIWDMGSEHPILKDCPFQSVNL